jgi:hypothetical protein
MTSEVIIEVAIESEYAFNTVLSSIETVASWLFDAVAGFVMLPVEFEIIIIIGPVAVAAIVPVAHRRNPNFLSVTFTDITRSAVPAHVGQLPPVETDPLVSVEVIAPGVRVVPLSFIVN